MSLGRIVLLFAVGWPAALIAGFAVMVLSVWLLSPLLERRGATMAVALHVVLLNAAVASVAVLAVARRVFRGRWPSREFWLIAVPGVTFLAWVGLAAMQGEWLVPEEALVIATLLSSVFSAIALNIRLAGEQT